MYFCAEIVSLFGNQTTGLFNTDDIKISDGKMQIRDYQEIDCSTIKNNHVWPLGDLVLAKLVNVVFHLFLIVGRFLMQANFVFDFKNDLIEGITGPFQLNSNGYRVNYDIQMSRATKGISISKVFLLAAICLSHMYCNVFLFFFNCRRSDHIITVSTN